MGSVIETLACPKLIYLGVVVAALATAWRVLDSSFSSNGAMSTTVPLGTLGEFDPLATRVQSSALLVMSLARVFREAVPTAVAVPVYTIIAFPVVESLAGAAVQLPRVQVPVAAATPALGSAPIRLSEYSSSTSGSSPLLVEYENVAGTVAGGNQLVELGGGQAVPPMDELHNSSPLLAGSMLTDACQLLMLTLARFSICV